MFFKKIFYKLLLFVAVGCSQGKEFIPEVEQMPFIIASAVAGNPVFVQTGMAGTPNSEPSYTQNAIVALYVNGDFVEYLTYQFYTNVPTEFISNVPMFETHANHVFVSEYICEPGDTLKLEVVNEFQQQLSSTAIVPKPCVIDFIGHEQDSLHRILHFQFSNCSNAFFYLADVALFNIITTSGTTRRRFYKNYNPPAMLDVVHGPAHIEPNLRQAFATTTETFDYRVFIRLGDIRIDEDSVIVSIGQTTEDAFLHFQSIRQNTYIGDPFVTLGATYTNITGGIGFFSSRYHHVFILPLK